MIIQFLCQALAVENTPLKAAREDPNISGQLFLFATERYQALPYVTDLKLA